MLTAIEKTPLYERLEKEGRLIPYDSAQMQGHGSADLNFVPKLMTIEEVQQGYKLADPQTSTNTRTTARGWSPG